MSVERAQSIPVASACMPQVSMCPPVGMPQAGAGAINQVQTAKITQLGMALRNFIANCDRILMDLNSAYNTEILDANTANHSLIGYFISSASYQKNLTVANEVDQLQQEAIRINNLLATSGIFLHFPMPLNTDFNGWSIRQAENSEHNFLADMFTSSGYSSMASTNTMYQISQTTQRVYAVSQQATNILTSLSFAGMQMANGGRPMPSY